MKLIPETKLSMLKATQILVAAPKGYGIKFVGDTMEVTGDYQVQDVLDLLKDMHPTKVYEFAKGKEYFKGYKIY